MCSYFFQNCMQNNVSWHDYRESMFVVHGDEWWFQTHASLEFTVLFLIADDVVKSSLELTDSRIPVGTNFAKLFQKFP